MPIVGRRKPKENVTNKPTPREAQIGNKAYVGEVYVNRKQVWKGTGASYEEAETKARQEAHKYPDARTTVVVRNKNKKK